MTELLDREGRTPDENERTRLSLRKAEVGRILRSPEWTLFREYMQDTARQLLERLLYGREEDVAESRAMLRATIEIAREFGVEEVKIQGRLLELDQIIQNQRGQLEAMLASRRGEL